MNNFQSQFKSSFEHNLISSFILWLDNKIISSLNAFSTGTSLFYPVPTQYVGLTAFGAPFKGIIADSSVNGATILTGVNVDNIWYNKGDSGLSINYNDGLLYFNSGFSANQISGTYSIKDFQVEFAHESEEKILFETDYVHKSKIGENGMFALPEGAKVYPAIYLKFYAGENHPWEMGGIDAIRCRITAIVLSDSQFKLIGIDSLCRDMARKYFAYLQPEELPFNSLGDLKTSPYNYTNLIGQKSSTDLIFIKRVAVSEFSEKLNVLINRNLWASIVDFHLEIPKTHVY